MAVNQLFRLVGTALSFALFGVGGMVLGVVAGAVLRVAVRDSAKRGVISRRLISRAFGAFVGFMTLVGVLRWRVEPPRPTSETSARLIIANHPTLIDVVFLLSMFPEADCVVKDSVYRSPFWGMLVRDAGYISNSDTEALMSSVVARLQAGRSVILFPEGTRTVPGAPLQFKAVAATIAIQAQVPCLPVAIFCDPATLYKGCKWYEVPVTRPQFIFRICEAVPPPALEKDRQNQRQAARSYSRLLEAVFSSELSR
jgi:1-acyl-sn-glycerol-3-phosphate acyltransferase